MFVLVTLQLAYSCFHMNALRNDNLHGFMLTSDNSPHPIYALNY